MLWVVGTCGRGGNLRGLLFGWIVGPKQLRALLDLGENALSLIASNIARLLLYWGTYDFATPFAKALMVEGIGLLRHRSRV